MNFDWMLFSLILLFFVFCTDNRTLGMIECINHNDEQEFTAEDSYTLNQFSTLIAVAIEMIDKSMRINDEIEISFIYYYIFIYVLSLIFFYDFKVTVEREKLYNSFYPKIRPLDPVKQLNEIVNILNSTITSIIQAKSSQLYMYTDNGEKQGLLTFDSNEIIPLTDDNKSIISFLYYIIYIVYFFNFFLLFF